MIATDLARERTPCFASGAPQRSRVARLVEVLETLFRPGRPAITQPV